MRGAMGRQRSGRWADRPDNVDLNISKGKTYFRYRFPDGKRGPLGDDPDKAFAAAKSLNAHFYGEANIAQGLLAKSEKASARNPAWPNLIKQFEREFIGERTYSKSSLEGIEYKLRQYEREWPSKTVRDFDTFIIGQFLEAQTRAAYVKHRSLLNQVFQYATHKGYRQDNPAAMTLAKSEGEKIRQRHTYKQLMQVRDKAEPWLQDAIDIGIYTMQRADDVCAMRLDQVDLEKNTIRVLQKKTRNYKNPVYIDIEMGSELRAAVERCVKRPIVGRTLIRRRPERHQAKRGIDQFSIRRDYLSRAFTETRDLAQQYSDLEPAQRPTFHEIRALGTHLYTEAGYSDEYIMGLTGHATKAMLERYRKDHEQKAPKLVAAGLSIAQFTHD